MRRYTASMVRCAFPGLLLTGLLLAACGPPVEPTRGVILISLDTLRADHLGTYGYHRDTSPFLDSLAAEGVVFEKAIAQFPSTLTSHMSIFTGLYPAEHAVYPPDSVLSPRIATLPELFRQAGYRTAGFAEDGYMEGRYGFARGFDAWSDEVEGTLPRAVETTFARGVEFLRSLDEDDRFFLFLHTYAVHDPYDPPPPYRSLYWHGDPPQDAFDPVGSNLKAFNECQGTLSEETRSWLEALYDASINYADAQLEALFAQLESLELAESVTVVLLSDHGEEFLEHGKLGHAQVYDEHMHVPWIVLHPRLKPRRVGGLVETIDLLPTLLELSGLRVPEDLSGVSRLPELLGRASRGGDEAYGTVRSSHTLYSGTGDGRLLQLVETDLNGRWFPRHARFDVGSEATQLEVRTHEEPHPGRIFVDGNLWRRRKFTPDWSLLTLPAGESESRRVRVEVDSWTPWQPPQGRSGACRGFQLSGRRLQRLELFDLVADPLGVLDVSNDQLRIVRRLRRQLAPYAKLTPKAPATETDLDPEQEERLRALGYL